MGGVSPGVNHECPATGRVLASVKLLTEGRKAGLTLPLRLRVRLLDRTGWGQMTRVSTCGLESNFFPSQAEEGLVISLLAKISLLATLVASRRPRRGWDKWLRGNSTAPKGGRQSRVWVGPNWERPDWGGGGPRSLGGRGLGRDRRGGASPSQSASSERS